MVYESKYFNINIGKSYREQNSKLLIDWFKLPRMGIRDHELVHLYIGIGQYTIWLDIKYKYED